MERDDLEEVVRIETEAFTSPWKVETFAGLLDSEAVELPVMVSDAGEIIGYAVLWCVLDQGELANVAISPGWRGRGLGTELIRWLVTRARERGVTKLFLEVRASNERAAAIYEKLGFEEVGVRRGYYSEPREDARVMLLRLRA